MSSFAGVARAIPRGAQGEPNGLYSLLGKPLVSDAVIAALAVGTYPRTDVLIDAKLPEEQAAECVVSLQVAAQNCAPFFLLEWGSGGARLGAGIFSRFSNSYVLPVRGSDFRLTLTQLLVTGATPGFQIGAHISLGHCEPTPLMVATSSIPAGGSFALGLSSVYSHYRIRRTNDVPLTVLDTFMAAPLVTVAPGEQMDWLERYGGQTGLTIRNDGAVDTAVQCYGRLVS